MISVGVAQTFVVGLSVGLVAGLIAGLVLGEWTLHRLRDGYRCLHDDD